MKNRASRWRERKEEEKEEERRERKRKRKREIRVGDSVQKKKSKRIWGEISLVWEEMKLCGKARNVLRRRNQSAKLRGKPETCECKIIFKQRIFYFYNMFYENL
ncbi:hypothetical protein ACOSQ3_014456 [Xanthoceras sorbifolium]